MYQRETLASSYRGEQNGICHQKRRTSSVRDSDDPKMEVTVDYTSSAGPTRTISLLQMLLLNTIVCGLEFCASAAFCYIIPMLLKAGLVEKNVTMVLGAGPLLGFFFVPIIGKASDRCRSRFGRRRPFILGLSLLLILSLVMIPYGESCAEAVLGKGSWSHTVGLWSLVIGAIMLDFASQACLTPCEALLSDASRNTAQYNRCFTIYSFMVSLGGCIGYLITALDWSTVSVGMYFGSQERSAFSMLVILFTFSMIASLSVADETPILNTDIHVSGANLLTLDAEQVSKNLDHIHQALSRQKDVQEPSKEPSGPTENSTPAPIAPRPTEDSTTIATPPSITVREMSSWTEWTLVSCETLIRHVLSGLYRLVPNMVKSLLHIPFVLQPLALANFFSWSAIMGFNLFYTDFVGQAVYGGDPNADEGSPLRERYDLGVRMGSWGLLFHCIVSALYAGLIERVAGLYGSHVTYMIGMSTFACAMILMSVFRNIYVVTVLAASTGFAYTTLTTIPFVLITLYHDHRDIFFYDTRGSPSRGVATDMATLDSAYFLSQVLLSGLMGYVVYVTGTVTAYIVCAGAMGVIACICVTRIITNKMQMQMLIKSDRLRVKL